MARGCTSYAADGACVQMDSAVIFQPLTGRGIMFEYVKALGEASICDIRSNNSFSDIHNDLLSGFNVKHRCEMRI